MADIGQTDFSQKNQVDLASIASLYQRKPVLEQEMATQQQQQETQKFDRVMGVMKMASEMTSNLIQYNAKKQMQTSAQALSEIMNKSEQTTADIAKARGLAVKVFPEETGKAMAKSLFEKPTAADMGRPQQGSVELKNKQIIPATFKNGKYYYPNTETVIPPEEIIGKGYGLVPVTDSEGNVNWVSRSSAKTIGATNTTTAPVTPEEVGTIKNYNALPVRVRTEVKSVIAQSQLDPTIKLNKNAYTQMNTLKEAIDSDNKALVGKLGVVFHRAMGDVGNMTAAEQVMPGSLQKVDKWKRDFNVYLKEGKLDAATKKELSGAMDTMKKALLMNYDNLVEVETNQVIEQYPQLDKEFVRKSIGGSLGDKDRKTIETVKDPMKQLNEIATKLDAMEKRRNAERR